MKTLFASALFFLILCSFGNANAQGSSCTPSSNYDRCYITDYNYGEELHPTSGEYAQTQGRIKVQYTVPSGSGNSQIKAEYIASSWADHDRTETTIFEHSFKVFVNGNQLTQEPNDYKLVDDDYPNQRWYTVTYNDALHSSLTYEFSATTGSNITFEAFSHASTCPDSEIKSMNELTIDHTQGNLPVFDWSPISITNATISGPSTRGTVENGDWTVNYSGGGNNITYQWEYKESSTWYTINPIYNPSADDQTLTFALDQDFELRATVSDENNSSDTSNPFFVTVISECGGSDGSGPSGPGCPSKVTSNQKKESFKFGLEPNYPNPFNPATTINYSLAEDSFVTLNVYNLSGQMVATIVEGDRSRGTHKATFNASSLSSGVYYYRLVAGSFSKIGKMTLIK